MPIIIPQNLPAVELLARENIFTMESARAMTQDIRPLRIAILNLMPTKVLTENQILRRLSNSSLQVEMEFLTTASYKSTHVPIEHLDAFYKCFDDVKEQKFDGMIITGAPIEHMAFEDVAYWQELTRIMEYCKHNVYSTLHICWGAQAGLYYHYGIKKYALPEKLFGVFPHTMNNHNHPLTRGFDDVFYVPHSRHTEVRREDILQVEDLEILSESEQAGVYLAASKDGRFIFATGHSEYDHNTLKKEYLRDLEAGKPINIPQNYFPNNDATKDPIVRWRGHSSMLFANWLNHFVYQNTPYNIEDINY